MASFQSPLFQGDSVLQSCLNGELVIPKSQVYFEPVVAVQKALIELRYLPAIPEGDFGFFGNKTADSLIMFQRDHGLTENGNEVNSETIAALDAALAAVPVQPDTNSTPPNRDAYPYQKGIDFIREAEGFRTNAYPDPATNAEPWTIGYGNTTYADGSPVRLGDKISKEQADDLLYDLMVKKYIPSMEKIPHWDIMTKSQQAALISFSWNHGPNWYNVSTFRKLRNMLDFMQWDDVAAEFYEFLGGPRVTGSAKDVLRSRRVAEGFMWYGAKIRIYNAWTYNPVPVVNDVNTTSPPPPTSLPWAGGDVAGSPRIVYDIDDYRTLPEWMLNTTWKDGAPYNWF